jgi:hypothetical protein
MFQTIIAHHQELGTVCAAIRCVSCEVPSSVVYIAVMVLWWWYSPCVWWRADLKIRWSGVIAMDVWWSFAGACGTYRSGGSIIVLSC